MGCCDVLLSDLPPHLTWTLVPLNDSDVQAQQRLKCRSYTSTVSVSAFYLDGEVVPHVIPHFEATQKRHPATSACWGVIVIEPPDGVQHADQPVAGEQKEEEEEDAGGC